MIILPRPSFLRFRFHALGLAIELTRSAWEAQTPFPLSELRVEINDGKRAMMPDSDEAHRLLLGNLEPESHASRNLVSSVMLVFHLVRSQASSTTPFSREIFQQWLLELQRLDDAMLASRGDSKSFRVRIDSSPKPALVIGRNAARRYERGTEEGFSMVWAMDAEGAGAADRLGWTPKHRWEVI